MKSESVVDFIPSPQELINDNPAAFIVNRVSYDLIGAHFSPNRFDPPQYARVATFSTSSEESIKFFLVDGNTRTMYVYEHQDEIAQREPSFVFNPRDVTDSLLQNPKVVLPEEMPNPGNSLTMVQYLRAVVPPTVEHSQIAPDRIAAHLINGWNSMIGDELASKFSALAAIGLLEGSNTPIATDTLLRSFLSSQEQLMVGEDPEERSKLEKGILEMASIIRQTKLMKRQIAESAYILVSSGSSVIGGERIAQRQIYGLLHIAEIESMLSEFPNIVDKERARLTLGELMDNAFKRFSGTRTQVQIISTVLGRVIRDTRLSFGEVSIIFEASQPPEKYEEIIRSKNKQSLRDDYMKSKKTQDLNEEELRLVESLGSRIHLSEGERHALIKNIARSAGVLISVEAYKNDLITQQNEYLQKGVSKQIIEEILLGLGEGTRSVLSATSIQGLTAKTTALRKRLAISEKRITREINIYNLGNVISQIFESISTEAISSVYRNNIAAYILREIDPSNENQVRQRLVQLISLDDDLRSRVLNNDLRVNRALQIQERRKKEPNNKSQNKDQSRESVDISVSTINPEITVRDFSAQRIEMNNQKFQQLTEAYIQDLHNQVDLDSAELSPNGIKVIENLLLELGNLRFGNRNIIKILEQEYPRLSQEVTRLREILVSLENQIASKDTRTRI